MKLTPEEVRKVAKLANLPIVGAEEKYSSQLSQILEYIDQLKKVETKGIGPLYNVTDRSNVLAEDQMIPSLPSDQALSNATKISRGFFVSKGVFYE